MAGFVDDIRRAARSLRRSPLFAFVCALTLALGIGANAAVLTVVDAVFLRGAPYREPDRLVHLWETTRTQPRRQMSFPDFLDVRDGARSFESVAGYGFESFSLTRADGALRIPAARVTANFFRTLGVPMAQGRDFREEEDRPLQPRTAVVLSHGMWQREFGSDPSIVGRQMTLSGSPFTVVGVLSAGFHFARVGDPQLYATISPGQAQVERRYMHWMWGIARLRPGVAREAADAELAQIAARRAEADAQWHQSTGLSTQPLTEALVGPMRPILTGLAASVAAVLLVACVNVAGMFLVRGDARVRELSVRAALGAPRAALVRQVLAECLVVGALGGLGGLLWAGAATQAMIGAIPAARLDGLPFLKSAGLGVPVALATVALSVVAGALFGLPLAFRAARATFGLRTSVEPASSRRFGATLIALEIAAGVALVAASLSLTRSLERLLKVDPGFSTSNLMTAQLVLPANLYQTPESRQIFFDALRARLGAQPGVAGVGLVDFLPLGGGGNTGSPTIVGRAAAREGDLSAFLRTVDESYFGTIGLDILRGRGFEATDRSGAPPVVVVNRAFADRAFPAVDPLAEKISFVFMDGVPLQIVGVVENENVTLVGEGMNPAVYFPWRQGSIAGLAVVVRSQGEAEASDSIARAIRAEARALEPQVAIVAVRSLEEIVANSAPAFLRRYPMLLVGWFAALGLALAAVGVYGVVAHDASRRTREIGVRIALGARGMDIAGLVRRQASGPIALGLGFGIALAIAANQAMRALLFETGVADPIALSGAVAALGLVAALAVWIPARRAARLDPVRALRME